MENFDITLIFLYKHFTTNNNLCFLIENLLPSPANLIFTFNRGQFFFLGEIFACWPFLHSPSNTVEKFLQISNNGMNVICICFKQQCETYFLWSNTISYHKFLENSWFRLDCCSISINYRRRSAARGPIVSQSFPL